MPGSARATGREFGSDDQPEVALDIAQAPAAWACPATAVPATAISPAAPAIVSGRAAQRTA
ncbi:hypothetical protein GCM10023147_33510 [Tsukamurella soli]|uniref:Uncharacterized protein n=1 Tax=Tsukamurella soli TaxID=644556 RepID=A0ABP8JXY5_9ACTN